MFFVLKKLRINLKKCFVVQFLHKKEYFVKSKFSQYRIIQFYLKG